MESRTRGKRLLELLGLVGILEDESVDEARCADLELDVVGLLVLLYAGGCSTISINPPEYPYLLRLSGS